MIDLKKYNLNKTQHRIIYSVSELNIVSIKEILNLLNISKQALNVNIRELMKQNLITEISSEKDKRIKILKLTKKGNELNNRINMEQTEKIHTLFSTSDEDWETAMIKLSKEYINGLNK